MMAYLFRPARWAALPSSRRALLHLAALAVLVATAATGCAQTQTAADAAATAAAGGRGGRGARGGGGGGVPVSVEKVIEKSVPVTATALGNVEAFTTVEVRTLVTGLLTSVEFAEGQDVTEGQLLFTIDPRSFDVALKQAQATLAKDTALVDNAKVQLQRNDDLMARGLMTRADHDTFAANVKSQQETLNADAAQVDNAKLQLQYTRITAPISGRTGALFVRKGGLVRTADANPLIVINQMTPVRATFSVPSKLLPDIRAGQAAAALRVQASASGQEGAPSEGRLSFIDNAVDSTTATIKLKATFPNTDRRLWPGEYVEVLLQLSVEPHAIVVPATAVQNGQQGQFAYVVKADKTVALRPVKVARADGDDLVIAEGLAAGEDVVTDGQRYLTPGVRVTIKPAVGGR
jgi:multidrug efflux system membrane fusion protein